MLAVVVALSISALLPPVPVEDAPLHAQKPLDPRVDVDPGAAHVRDAGPPRWADTKKEINDAAAGSLEVCSTVLLPVSLVPGVGEAATTVFRWACVLPAAVAVDYVAVHHGNSSAHYWQALTALGVQQLWETLLAVPVPFTVVGVALASGSIAPRLQQLGLSENLVAGASIGAVSGALALSDVIGEAGGRFLFSLTYDVLTEEIEGPPLDARREQQWIQPKQLGRVSSAYAMVAAAAGAEPAFRWTYLLPVYGPIARAPAQADAVKEKMRRAARDVLGVEKRDLSSMDAAEEVLAYVDGWMTGVGHAALGVGFALTGAGFVLTWTDQKGAAEQVGSASVIVSSLGGALLLGAQIPDAVRPALVPAMWAWSE